jgi:hypothetical protein
MYEVNRSVAILRPQAPFLDWLKALPGSIDAELTLESLTSNSNALLIPPSDDMDALREYVLAQYHSLFQAELADWCDDRSLWPEPLSAELFAQWFAIQIHPVLTDIVDDSLEREYFTPLEINPD